MTLKVFKIAIWDCFHNMSRQSNTNESFNSPSERLIDSDDSSSDASVDDSLKVTEEEKRGTIPGSTTDTAMALAGARAQSNPTVERGPPRRKKKVKKPKTTVSTATQTNVTDKTAK